MKKKAAKYPITIREWSEDDRPREKLLKYGEHTPWNEIRPKKHPSPGIPVVPLWQNSWNVRCAIPLGPAPPAPLNRVQPVKFTPVISKRISLGYLQGVQLGWNLYPARNLDTNGHIEVECFNLLKPDGTIPLGPAPWNLYPARNLDTNGHIEVKYFNLLTPDGTIPLGFCYCSKKRFSKSSTNAVLVELFYVYSFE